MLKASVATTCRVLPSCLPSSPPSATCWRYDGEQVKNASCPCSALFNVLSIQRWTRSTHVFIPKKTSEKVFWRCLCEAFLLIDDRRKGILHSSPSNQQLNIGRSGGPGIIFHKVSLRSNLHRSRKSSSLISFLQPHFQYLTLMHVKCTRLSRVASQNCLDRVVQSLHSQSFLNLQGKNCESEIN